MPELRPVTIHNWRELSRLKVREDQRNFVATNLHSIAEAQFGYDGDDGHWDFHPFGIYEKDVPVGFCMYGFNYGSPKQQAFIIRLMVDENHQGKGFGRFGMEEMLEIFRADERVETVGISYEPENEVARKLYAKLGFKETGEVEHNELVAALRIR